MNIDASPADKSDLSELLIAWIDHDELSEELHDIAVDIARDHLAKHPLQRDVPKEDEWRDLAGDFLLYEIRAKNMRSLESKSGMRTAFSRFITARRDPEQLELWDIVSAALHELGKQGRIRRLDADHTKPNHNRAKWTSAGPDQDEVILHIADFEANCRNIPGFYPKRTEGRIVAPSDAQVLVTRLLDAAGCPVTFDLLHKEARRHVVLLLRHREDIDAPLAGEGEGETVSRELVDQDSEAIEWVSEEAGYRADSIWHEANTSGHGEVLCMYTLPKKFLGKQITMEGLGQPQRIGEQHLDILSMMGGHLRIERLSSEHQPGSDSTFDSSVRQLVSRVAGLLMEKCSEKGWNRNF